MLNIYINIYNIFAKIIQIRTSEVVHFHTIYAKLYIIYEFVWIRTNDLHLTLPLNLHVIRV